MLRFWLGVPGSHCSKKNEAACEGSHALERKEGVLPETSCAPQDGDTPLQIALVFGHPAVVEKLLAGGVDKEAKNKVREGGDGQWG